MKKRPEIKGVTVSAELSEDDAKLFYAVYKLKRLPSGWTAQQDLKPQEFVDNLDEFIRRNYDINWSVRKNEKPMAVILGMDAGKHIVIGDMIWHPKATPRTKLEVGVTFFKEIRLLKSCLVESEYKYKKFYERLCDYSLLRRVGSLYDTIDKNSKTLLFQTRKIWLT